MNVKPFCFEDWEIALRETVPPELQSGYREAIVKFRYWLRQTDKQPDAETFKEHLDCVESYFTPAHFELRGKALQWYCKEGLHRAKPTAEKSPSSKNRIRLKRAYTKARSGRKAPTVLTQTECKRLFEAMEGTSRLMAELMYAAGLRLSELLRLRVKDVDLERLQLAVQSGKGGKSRLTMISKKLEPALRAHRKRLRTLHAKDRKANLPGVELPEALERKWPKAGEKFIWFWFWPSRNLLRDHRSGIVRRHHVLDVTFQKAIRIAVERAGFDKRVSPHTLRHSFATHLLASGVGIRDCDMTK